MKNIKEMLSTKDDEKIYEGIVDYNTLKNAGYPSSLCRMMDDHYKPNDNITAGAFCAFLLAISDMINKK